MEHPSCTFRNDNQGFGQEFMKLISLVDPY
jgi:hypothetical protein